MTYLVAITLGVLLVQLVWLWRLTRALARWRTVEERVTHFGDALALLTETADTGFRAMAGEVERLATADPRALSIKARRIADGLRQGRTPADVATGEQVSEGEVRLRMHLAPPSPDRVHDAPAARKARARSRRAPAAAPAPPATTPAPAKAPRRKKTAPLTPAAR